MTSSLLRALLSFCRSAMLVRHKDGLRTELYLCSVTPQWRLPEGRSDLSPETPSLQHHFEVKMIQVCNNSDKLGMRECERNFLCYSPADYCFAYSLFSVFSFIICMCFPWGNRNYFKWMDSVIWLRSDLHFIEHCGGISIIEYDGISLVSFSDLHH